MSTPYIYHHRTVERTFVMYLYFFVTIPYITVSNKFRKLFQIV